MTTRLLRPLDQPGDLDAIVHLRLAWAREHGRTGDPGQLRRDVETWLRSEGDARLVWVAEDPDGADPVGMVSLFLYSRMPDVGRRQGRWGYVAQLYVRPAARRRGVATALVAALTAHAQQEGLDRLVLHPSPVSEELYAGLGFRRADELLLLPLR